MSAEENTPENKENKITQKEANAYHKPLFLLFQITCVILLLVTIYYDIFYDVLKFKTIGVDKIISDKVLNYLLRVIGAYGLMQVFAQDIGFPIGNIQKNITHYPISKYMLLFSSGFSLTGDRSETLIATIIYFYLRNILSTNTISESTWN